jgi:hypothetical protein
MSGQKQEKKVAHITVSRCMKTGKDFGIRWEKQGPDEWIATWSFKLQSPQGEKNEFNTNKTEFSGNFRFPDSYPGCPYCQGRITVQCQNCNHIYCHDISKGVTSVCPWCQAKLIFGGSGGGNGRISVSGPKDR